MPSGRQRLDSVEETKLISFRSIRRPSGRKPCLPIPESLYSFSWYWKHALFALSICRRMKQQALNRNSFSQQLFNLCMWKQFWTKSVHKHNHFILSYDIQWLHGHWEDSNNSIQRCRRFSIDSRHKHKWQKEVGPRPCDIAAQYATDGSPLIIPIMADGRLAFSSSRTRTHQ